jgi:hypothetical protein
MPHPESAPYPVHAWHFPPKNKLPPEAESSGQSSLQFLFSRSDLLKEPYGIAAAISHLPLLS